MVLGEQSNNEFCGLLCCGGCSLWGPDTGDYSDIPRVFILDAKKQ